MRNTNHKLPPPPDHQPPLQKPTVTGYKRKGTPPRLPRAVDHNPYGRPSNPYLPILADREPPTMPAASTSAHGPAPTAPPRHASPPATPRHRTFDGYIQHYDPSLHQPPQPPATPTTNASTAPPPPPPSARQHTGRRLQWHQPGHSRNAVQHATLLAVTTMLLVQGTTPPTPTTAAHLTAPIPTDTHTATTEMTGAPPITVPVFTLSPAIATTIPLAINVTARSTRPKAHHKRLQKDAVWDSGAGASFIDRKLALALGARIRKTSVPMFFHGFNSDDHTHSSVNEIATIHITAGTCASEFTCWVCTTPPMPLLIGRDNMRSVDGHGCTLRTDEHAYVQFDGHEPVPAIQSRTLPHANPTLLVTLAHDTRLRGSSLDYVDVIVPTQGARDIWVEQQDLGGLHVFDQTVCTDEHGHASVLVHNTATLHTDTHRGSTIAIATPVATAPLHPTTEAVLDYIELRDQLPAPTTAPAPPTRRPARDQTASAGAHYTESKPTTSHEVRGTSWKGHAFSSHEEAATSFSQNLPTEKELDQQLQDVVAAMDVGTPEQRDRTLTMLRKHRHAGLFSTVENKHGKIKGHKVSVELKSNNPIFTPPYGSTPMQNEELCRQTEELLQHGHVKPTVSANNFPTLLVSKGEAKTNPDGSITQTAPRLTLDLRKLNPLIFTEFFELPNVRHLCDTLAASSLHSSFDCTSGYSQVELSDTDTPKSVDMMAFTLPHCRHRLSGQRFSFTRMVMGMRDSGARFSRILHAVLAKHGYVHQYIDDIFVSNGDVGQDITSTVDEHITRIDAVFTTLAASGVKLAPTKLDPFKTSIEALGHTISNHTVTVSKKKTDAIRGIQPPTNRSELEIAMGVLGVARRFMPAFAEVALPLYKLLAKDWRTFKWEAPHQAAFDEIKRRFDDTHALHAPNFDLPFEIHADSSGTAAASMLTQRDPDTGINNIVEFHSKQLSDAERNYTTAERECLSLVISCRRWRAYLLSSNKFTLVLRNDHAGIQWAHRNADSNSRLFRWCQQLSEFDYTIEWSPGKDMIIPDALSRVSMINLIHATQGMMAATTTSILPVITKPAPQPAPQPSTVTFNIDRLVSEHRSPHNKHAKVYRVRWIGYPHPDQDTLEPLAQLRKDLTISQLKTLRATFSTSTTTTADNALPPPPGFAEYFDNTSTQRTPAQLCQDNATELDLYADTEHPTPTHTPFTANTFPHRQLLPNLSTDTVAIHQRRDKRLNDIINNINTHTDHHIHSSDVLMRSYIPSEGPRKGHDISTIALPESLISLALAATHTACGHHGETSTIFAMQTRFSFPNLHRRTQGYVRSCKDCSRAKRDLRPVHLGRIPVFDWLSVVSIDFAGPMRTTINGNRHLAIIVDHSTKHVHVHPCKSTSTTDATAALLSFTQHCGLPGRVVSDRGSAFTSKAWAGLMAAVNTTSKTTTAYNPQGNSHAEAQVGNIKGIIKMICQRHPRHWDEAARWAAWSYNQSYNSTIGTTPQFARTGREARSVPDIVFNSPHASSSLTLTQLVQRVNDVHTTTQKRVEAMHDKFIRKNEKMHRTRTFTTGQQVWLHRVYPGITKPAANGQNKSFFWPFRPDVYDIISHKSKQHATIRNRSTGISQTVHTRRLKPYTPQQDCFDFSDLHIQEDTSE